MERIRSFLGPLALGTASLGIVALLSAGLVYLLLPELRDAAFTLVGIGLLLLLLFVLGALPQIRQALLARQARYGTNTTVMVLALIAIAVVVNLIAVRSNLRFDLTASGQFTLARQTVTVLKALDKPVKVTGFFQASDALSQSSQTAAENLLREYRYHSGNISYEFVDPDAKPAVARQFEIRDYGALVFESDGHRKEIFGIGEQDFTGAILSVTGTEQKKVYFLGGHGEHDIGSADSGGFLRAKEGLDADNYQVKTLDLSADPNVPSDAAAVIIAGPKKPLLTGEVSGLREYLERGGKALLLLNPNPSPEWSEVLTRWGITFRPGSVIDTVAFAQPDIGTPAVLKDQYYFNQITKDLDTTFFPGATALFPEVQEKDPFLLLPLFETSPQSWLETDMQQVRFDEGKDVKGPLLLGLTVEGAPRPSSDGAAVDGRGASPGSTRMVVIGDSDFASNEFFYSKFNSDLFLNAVNWLAAQEELISIRPKPPEFRRLVITQRGWTWILYSSIVFLPLTVLLAGGVSWWRRR